MAHLLLALTILAQTPGSPDVDRALREAAAQAQAGQSIAALEAIRAVLERVPRESAEAGRALIVLASVQTGLGKYADAARNARAAAIIFASLRDARNEALALNWIGLAALYGGKYGDAYEAFRAAVERSSGAGNQDLRAEQLGNVANVHFYVGRYADAARTYDEALAVVSAAGAERWTARRRRLLTLNKASLYQKLGRYQQALDLYTSLGSAEGSLPPHERGQMLANMGALYRRLGDPVKAVQTYDAALALFARDRHVNSELNTMKNRGIALALDLGQLEAADATFSKALDAATAARNRREMLHARLYRGQTRLRAEKLRAAREDFEAALQLARELATPEEEWKALQGLGQTAADRPTAVNSLAKAVGVIEALREAIRIPALRSDFFNDKREVYDELIATRTADASPADVFQLVEGSHSRAWRDHLGLAGVVNLASVQTALPGGVLLLDYWHSARGTALIAVTHTRAAIFSAVVKTAHIQALADALASRGAADWRRRAEPLAALLPPSDWLHAIDHIVIVPDGVLSLVPFEVLPAGDRLLVERAAISYTPTAATLLRARSGMPRVLAPWRLQLRAFGDPIASAPDAAGIAPPRGRLVASADEVRAVADELGGAAALHVGPDNRKAHLTAGNQPPLLHLATHAMADANAMERSHIVFSAPGESVDGDFLFLREAYDLPLGGVELAVLSACETERGSLLSGEGVQSFSRAFMAAGARSTVTTLWRVPDRPTADFMRLFYHYLRSGLARDEALRRAKLAFLHSGSNLSHPHVWAPFVLTGDGLRPVPWAVTWRMAVLTLVLPALAVAAVYWRRRRLNTQP